MLDKVACPLRGYSFLIVGTVRNCQDTISEEVHRLKKIFDGSVSVYWLLIESDSVDDTEASLRGLKLEVPFFDYISMGQLSYKYPQRARRIAVCRDVYVNEIRTRPEYLSIDYVVVADLDGMCRQITPESVQSCWIKQDWMACFANQPKGYYDLWALRHNYWSPRDPYRTFNCLVNLGVNSAKAYKISMIDKILKIKPGSKWIAVESAFGGLGIYRYEAFMMADYSVDGDYPHDTCEHVTFNRKLKGQPAKLYINPALVNVYRSSHVFQMKLKYVLLRVFGLSIFEKLKSLKLR